MKKRRTFTVMIILIAVLVLGVGYAAISNVVLNITGSANIVADADFSVVFDTGHDVLVTPASSTTISFGGSNHPVAAGAYTDTLNATMTVYLNKDNTSASACYKIDNNSSTLAASISPSVTPIGSPNTAYFGNITTALYSDSGCSTAFSGNLAAGQSVYLKVTVPKGNTEPAQDVADASFGVTITATPQQ